MFVHCMYVTVEERKVSEEKGGVERIGEVWFIPCHPTRKGTAYGYYMWKVSTLLLAFLVSIDEDVASTWFPRIEWLLWPWQLVVV